MFALVTDSVAFYSYSSLENGEANRPVVVAVYVRAPRERPFRCVLPAGLFLARFLLPAGKLSLAKRIID